MTAQREGGQDHCPVFSARASLRVADGLVREAFFRGMGSRKQVEEAAAVELMTALQAQATSAGK